jgi:hypothetical protein
MMPVQLQSRSYHELSHQEVIEYWISDAEVGLTAEEVASRYETYGWNELIIQAGQASLVEISTAISSAASLYSAVRRQC